MVDFAAKLKKEAGAKKKAKPEPKGKAIEMKGLAVVPKKVAKEVAKPKVEIEGEVVQLEEIQDEGLREAIHELALEIKVKSSLHSQLDLELKGDEEKGIQGLRDALKDLLTQAGVKGVFIDDGTEGKLLKASKQGGESVWIDERLLLQNDVPPDTIQASKRRKPYVTVTTKHVKAVTEEVED